MLGTTFFAWWGAGLSSLLALAKLWEFWRDRFQVEVSGTFTSSPEIGNDIFVRNLSARAFILAHWELLYRTGRWPARSFSHLASREYDSGDTRIESHSTHTLSFCEQAYFYTNVDALKGRRIFIRLSIAGRRPILRLLYSP